MAQSFAKNMGLYGERVGALNITCSSQSEAEAVLSNVKQRVVRPSYSSPPLHGARIATQLLTDAALRELWMEDLRGMSDRITEMRTELVAELERIEAPGKWAALGKQVGMFAFTGLQPEHVEALQEQHGVYITKDGRMSLAGLRRSDVAYVAAAIKSVLVTA